MGLHVGSDHYRGIIIRCFKFVYMERKNITQFEES